MIGGRLGWLKAIAGLGLAAGAAACGGDAFTTAKPDGGIAGVDAKVPEAGPGDAGTPAPADAGAGWCATQSPTHTFCEDFLRGVPGKLVGVTVGAMLVPDPTDYESPPQSMAAVTPALAKKGDSATALATRDFSSASGTQFTLASYFKVASSCFPTNGVFDPVSIAVVQFPQQDYGIVIDVTPSSVELVEVTLGADGGQILGSPRVTTFNAANLLDTWQLWTLTIDGSLTGKSVSLSVGGAAVIPAHTALKAAALLLQHPTLYLGATIKNDQGLSAGCRVHVDDVLFDVKAVATPAN
jgi:hypothetical protein